MGIFSKLKEAYRKATTTVADDELEYGVLVEDDAPSGQEAGKISHANSLSVSTPLEELVDGAEDDATAFLKSLTPEMQEFIGNEASKPHSENTIGIGRCVLPLQLLTDKPTATQIITLLGMLRWCMEQSAKGGGENREFEISVKIRNRGKSPLLLSIGDVTIPDIPMEENMMIGN